MWKNWSKKVRGLVFAGGVVGGVLVIGLIGSLALRADVETARKQALTVTGGGEIVAQELDREGPWSEYSFDIVHEDTWYEVEVNTFGWVTGVESSQGGYSDDRNWG